MEPGVTAMPNQHALLSPSSSERWLHCPRSARLCEDMADTTSSYASEGTEAHALCEHLLLQALGRNTTDPRPLFKQYSTEMQEAAENYTQYVMEQVADFRAKGIEPAVYVEQRLDLRAFIPDCMGTSDAIVVGGDTVIVIDFKFGNLPVPATSPQLRIYSLGVCELLSCLYDFTRVKTVIFQPRLSTIDEAEITKDDLYTWANDVLAPIAQMAYEGKGEFECGDWCRFCRARNQCRTLAEHQMALAQYDFREPPLLADDEIASILTQVDALVNWANGIKDYALQAALAGTRFPGWKVVEGRANRRYVNEEAVAEKVIADGKNPYEQKLLGITAMEKLLGKKHFAELLAGLVERPQGKPVLVTEDDKRPEMNTAQNDFND